MCQSGANREQAVGRPIVAAAAFQAAPTGVAKAARRLKTGGSQDWPPHKVGTVIS